MLAELDEELDAAEAHHDFAKHAKRTAEREALVAEIKRATGLGGRPRRAGSPTEKARLNVTRTIRHAINYLSTALPELAAGATREGEVTRKDLWITSKLWCNAHGKKNVGPAIKKSLSDFGLDYFDMYMVHWPVALKPSAVFPGAATDFASAAEAPMQDTWGAMEAVQAEGLTRHVGVSNFSAKKVKDLLSHAKVKPEANQIELHPFLQQKALVDYCTSQGIHVTAYSPLGSGDRPDFLKAATDPVPLESAVIKSIAEARKCTPAQVLLAWHVQRGLSTLPKSINPARLRENFAATDVRLTLADLEPIAGLDQGFRFIAGAFWAIQGSPWTLENLWDEPQKA